jgi:hypothetical protein
MSKRHIAQTRSIPLGRLDERLHGRSRGPVAARHDPLNHVPAQPAVTLELRLIEPELFGPCCGKSGFCEAYCCTSAGSVPLRQAFM